MAHSYKIFPDQNVIYVRFERVVHTSEVPKVVDRYTRDPDFRPRMTRLVDMSRITEIGGGYEDLKTMLEMLKNSRPAEDFRQTIVYFATTEAQIESAETMVSLWSIIPTIDVVVAQSTTKAMTAAKTESKEILDLLSGWAPMT